MNATLGLLAAGPAAGAAVLAFQDAPRAGRAADRGEALVEQRMPRQLEILERLIDLRLAPARQRIDLDLAIADFGDRQRRALLGLEALAAGEPGVELLQRGVERQHLAQVAAAVRLLRPQIARRVFAREVGRARLQRTRVGEAEAVDQDIAIGESLEEVLAGLEEQHRRRLVDL